jgi:hypothetical protein
MIKLGTNTTTMKVLVAYIKAWLMNDEPPCLSEIAPDASKYLIEAVNDQNKLGCDQWLRGRISIKWGELYNEDILRATKPIKYASASRWGTSVIAETWKLVLECWAERNKSEHDSDGDPINRKGKKKCVKKSCGIAHRITGPIRLRG